MVQSMANKTFGSVDYDEVLSDLRAKKKEVDKAIEAIENLKKIGFFSGNSSSYQKSIVLDTQKTTSNVATMSVYNAAVFLLEKEGHTLTTRQVVEAILKE